MFAFLFGRKKRPAPVQQRTPTRLRFEQLEERCMMAGTAVLDWNTIAIQAVADDHTPAIVATPDQGGPTRPARALGIVHGAIFDAVNTVDRSYSPYLVNSADYEGASVDAAVAQAAHDTLVALYPHQKATFDRELLEALAQIPDGPAESMGVALGEFAAATALKARKNDGAGILPTYKPGTAPGDHRPDPLHPNQGFVTPDWGRVTPFMMESGSQFRAPPPPALDSPQYAASFNEVQTLGGDGINTFTLRTPEQTEIGIYWGYDGSPGLGTPPRLYNQIVQTVAIQQGNSEVENARLFALVNLAMADAGIASWENKYEYDFWRPVVAIREADAGTSPSGLGDGNAATVGDVGWTPLGAPRSNDPGGTNFTPPFPAYTSGHATFGGATFQSLANFFGRDDIAFSFISDEYNGVTTDQDGTVRPVVTRNFTSFSQAAAENAQSRIYLGIHWSFDASEGITQGNAVANYAFEHHLQPVGP